MIRPFLLFSITTILLGCSTTDPATATADTRPTEHVREISAEERDRREAESYRNMHRSLNNRRNYLDQKHDELLRKVDRYAKATNYPIDIQQFVDIVQVNIASDTAAQSDPLTYELDETFAYTRQLFREYEAQIDELESIVKEIEDNFVPELVDYSVQNNYDVTAGAGTLKVTLYQGPNKPGNKPRTKMIYAIARLEKGKRPTYEIDGHHTWPTSSNGWGRASRFEIMASDLLDDDYRLSLDVETKPHDTVSRTELLAMANSANLLISLYDDRESPRIGPIDISVEGKQAIIDLVDFAEQLSQ